MNKLKHLQAAGNRSWNANKKQFSLNRYGFAVEQFQIGKEFPDYHTRLAKMEEEAKVFWSNG